MRIMTLKMTTVKIMIATIAMIISVMMMKMVAIMIVMMMMTYGQIWKNAIRFSSTVRVCSQSWNAERESMPSRGQYRACDRQPYLADVNS